MRFNLNYNLGVFEQITTHELTAFTLNNKVAFKLDNRYSFAVADVELFTDQAGTMGVPLSSFQLEADTVYTTLEAGDDGSGKTVYKSITIVDNTYAGIPLYITCNNFGTFTDNESIQSQIDQLFEGTANFRVSDSVVRYGTTDGADGIIYADGRALSRTTFSALFDIIGTTYGVGDGSTTFNIPDQTDYPTPLETNQKWHIKAEGVTPRGQKVSALKYTTGWLSTSTWIGGATIDITHDLMAENDELNYEIFVRDPLANTVKYNVTNVTDLDSTSHEGQVINGKAGSETQVELQIGSASGVYINSSGVHTPVPTNWEYLIIIYKPSLIDTFFTPTTRSFIINDANDVTIRIASATQDIAEKTFFRLGTGTGKLIIETLGGLFHYGDATASTVTLEGIGKVVIAPSAGTQFIKEYVDDLSISDSGVNTDRHVTKTQDGKAKIIGKIDIVFSGGTNVIGNGVFGYTFSSVDVLRGFKASDFGTTHFLTSGFRSNTTTSFQLHAIDIAGGNRTGTFTFDYEVIGTWR